LSLPALGALGYIKLHCLAFLQAFETARLNRRKMHENVLARLAADEAVALGVVEPLYCSLFCHVVTVVLFNQFTLERLGGIAGRLLACEARAAHDRLGLTYKSILRATFVISKRNAQKRHALHGTLRAARACITLFPVCPAGLSQSPAAWRTERSRASSVCDQRRESR